MSDKLWCAFCGTWGDHRSGGCLKRASRTPESAGSMNGLKDHQIAELVNSIVKGIEYRPLGSQTRDVISRRVVEYLDKNSLRIDSRSGGAGHDANSPLPCSAPKKCNHDYVFVGRVNDCENYWCKRCGMLRVYDFSGDFKKRRLYMPNTTDHPKPS